MRNAWYGGRSNRKQYWIMMLVLIALGVAIQFIPGVKAGSIGVGVVWLMVWGRRLHDIGRSAWWGAIPFILAGVCGFFGEVQVGLATSSPSAEGAVSQQELVGLALLLVGLLVQFGFTIWLGVVKGDPNENRFGAPAGGKPSPAQVF
jgi:uncharacterized membrane protein YhaH (DUF805 family)